MTVIADAASPVRRLTLGDAPVLARLVRANRDFLAPTSPVRAEDWIDAVTATFWLIDAPDNLAEQSRRNPDGTGIGVFDA
ncbi:MAG: hypothetical protein J0H43_08315, partial [Actinobacteria bacterium]|nr:hypothetical protein [Actinomycetota bacterium]